MDLQDLSDLPILPVQQNLEDTKYKVILLGATTVGKTAIINRIKYNKFFHNIKATTGGTCIQTTIGNIDIQLWDTSGQERYKMLAELYYRNANVILLVFDLNNKHTLDDIKYYKKQIEQKLVYGSYQIIIVGNKKDLVTDNRIKHLDNVLYTEFPDIDNDSVVFISAKTNDGIHKLLDTIVEKIKLVNIDVTINSAKYICINTSDKYTNNNECITNCTHKCWC